MVEHRLIEKMIDLLKSEVGRIEETGSVSPVRIDTAVDFIRTYADRIHHGKEEDILFRDLRDRDLSSEDRAVMDELVEEHIYARQTVQRLVDSKERYVAGGVDAIDAIGTELKALVDLYPAHIVKEDKVFFPASMKYLSRSEQDNMLEEMAEFDRQMIHEKYRSVVQALGAGMESV